MRQLVEVPFEVQIWIPDAAATRKRHSRGYGHRESTVDPNSMALEMIGITGEWAVRHYFGAPDRERDLMFRGPSEKGVDLAIGGSTIQIKSTGYPGTPAHFALPYNYAGNEFTADYGVLCYVPREPMPGPEAWITGWIERESFNKKSYDRVLRVKNRVISELEMNPIDELYEWLTVV